MIYLKLFLSFLQIGLFSFGGGYAAMPFIRDQVVVQNSWLSMQEFTDLITLSQMTPGPIAVNSATFVGIKTAGALGAVCAAAGVSIAVAAFWCGGFSLASTEWVLVAAFAVCLLLLRKTKLNPVLVMLLAGVINTVYRLALG